MSQFSRGDIVFSKMGRDQGRYYIVVDVNEKFAFIADGKLHKIQKPKKKKFRHLIHLGANSTVIEEKIKNGMFIEMQHKSMTTENIKFLVENKNQ